MVCSCAPLMCALTPCAATCAGAYSGVRQEQPFTFEACNRPVNWRRINAVDTDTVSQTHDSSSIFQLIDEVAHADLAGESVFQLTEANLMQVRSVILGSSDCADVWNSGKCV